MSERTLRFRMVILKVCILLTLLSIISVAIYAQKDSGGNQNAIGDRFTMNARNVTYREVFSEIKRQTGKVVWYDSNFDDTRKINVAFKDAPINDVMNFILKNTGLSWKTHNEAIMINGKDTDKSVGAGPKEISTNQSRTGMSDSANNLIDITGSITDENGSPIPGATVLIKGTQTGTITNGDGVFILKAAPFNATLTISSISFLSKEIQVKSRKNIGPIQLNKFVGQLDETVILAYSKTTNRLLTGNVSRVKVKEIENSPVNNPILAVAARVPGVIITQATGFSGSGVEVVVQGYNSLQRGVTPFYVIDGVPYAQMLLSNLGNMLKTSGRGDGDGSVNGNPLSFINPGDIESIEILKDADATAIYGSRAANGAIIITTKRGKSGRIRADFTIQKGIGNVSRRLNLLNTTQYLEMRKEGKLNDNAPVRPTDYDLNGTWDSTKNTDWQKVLIGGNSNYTDIQSNFSGGGPTVKYLLGSSYHKETTVFPTDLADIKVGLRLNLDVSSPDKKFQLNFSGSYLLDNNKLPVEDITRYAMILAPNMPDLLKADGSLNWGTNSIQVSTINPHPLAFLKRIYSNRTSNLISNAVLSYSVIDGLTVKANLGYTDLQTDEISTLPVSAAPPERRPLITRTSTFGFNKINSWIIEPQINFSRKISSGDLSMIAGMSIQETNKNRKVILASGFADDISLENLNAANEITSPINSAILSDYKYTAGFFQLNYNWINKYIINLSGRRDGSSRFGINNRFHNFGALGLAWIFTNENFFKNRSTFLSYGKLKASYGTTGNDQIGDYNYLSLYDSNNGDIPYREGSSLEITKIPNPYLQWEETKKLSLGIDLGFISDRFLLSAVLYQNRSSNMLITSSIPSTAGPLAGLIANLPATIQNKGIEMSVNTTNITGKKFSWTSAINVTIPKNKLIAFSNLENSTYNNTYIIGEPINIERVYRSHGVNSATGKYEFLDKDGKITDNPTTDLSNYNKIIDPNPKFYGGINNSFSFKGITLDILFQYVKQLGRNTPYSGNPPGMGRNNQTTNVLNRWQKGGDVAQFQRFTSSNADLVNSFFYQLLSDAYWEDASFLRCKNIALSYNLPSHLVNKVKIQSCRVFVTGQNLFTITKYKGLDPESQSNFTMPPLRVITFGINATL
ncbi:SusC/RagA family TonB-linked outer membrane protein [Chitinophaga polysaccharea]|uniref:SusC/RagA family TonB-linked outer membrane protein n=1 Tax=Chitinophaga polysaccharea TaxID=1293035 RepID=UPI001455A466|nr:SusC/RagA family TonB-linked outer membrane protein [Chitinophaga polysaccharea]NLR60705.1 SusC/RagA family TonB-linked outer membrane protein [Chitinophaga polysaccharea]